MSEGRKWVRGTLSLTLGLSMAANIGHTLLADSTIPAWLRMIGAVAWPVLIFLAVEILVRVAWQPRASHRLARLLILVPGIPAAITSYEHMHAVLMAMGERPFIAAIGPGAVDLMMIGCTLTLLFTREVGKLSEAARAVRLSMVNDWIDAGETPDIDAVIAKWGITEETLPIPVSPAVELPIPVSPSPADLAFAEQRERSEAVKAQFLPQVREYNRARTGRPEAEKAIRLMLDGRRDEAVPALMGDSTMRRYEQVARILRDDPLAEVNVKGARPDLVAIMREELRTERAR
jgi:hypothetical protein